MRCLQRDGSCRICTMALLALMSVTVRAQYEEDRGHSGAGGGGVRGYTDDFDFEDDDLRIAAGSRSLESIPPELSDPAFDRYVDTGVLLHAWETKEPALLTDLALQLAEGERVLLRSHKAISADTLMEIAIRAAGEKKNTATLGRLSKAIDRTGSETLKAQYAISLKLGQESRADDPDTMISVSDTTPQTYATFQRLVNQILNSVIGEDLHRLVETGQEIVTAAELSDQDRDRLFRIMERSRSAIPDDHTRRTEFATLNRLSAASRADSYDSDRNDVRSGIAAGGWNPVYGELVNEAEYAKFAASAYFGNPAMYFRDYYQRTVDRMKRELPGVASASVEKAVSDALRGRKVTIGKLGIKGGIATYRRWKRMVYHEPATREKWLYGPLGTKTKIFEAYLRRVEKKVPLPNHHQPYIAFRYYSTSDSGSGPGTSSEAGFTRWKVTNNTDDGELLHVRIYRTESPGRDGSKEWHVSLTPGQTMTFSGHGISGSAPRMHISYWNDAHQAEPRGELSVGNFGYVFTGRRGRMNVDKKPF